MVIELEVRRRGCRASVRKEKVEVKRQEKVQK